MHQYLNGTYCIEEIRRMDISYSHISRFISQTLLCQTPSLPTLILEMICLVVFVGQRSLHWFTNSEKVDKSVDIYCTNCPNTLQMVLESYGQCTRCLEFVFFFAHFTLKQIEASKHWLWRVDGRLSGLGPWEVVASGGGGVVGVLQCVASLPAEAPPEAQVLVVETMTGWEELGLKFGRSFFRVCFFLFDVLDFDFNMGMPADVWWRLWRLDMDPVRFDAPVWNAEEFINVIKSGMQSRMWWYWLYFLPPKP